MHNPISYIGLGNIDLFTEEDIQIDLILGPDNSHLEDLLNRWRNPDPVISANALQQLLKCKDSGRIGRFFVKLAGLALSFSDVLRMTSLDCIYQFLDSKWWNSGYIFEADTVKGILIECVLREDDHNIMINYLCKVISNLALFSIGQFNRHQLSRPWPELFDFMLDCLHSNSNFLQWAALDVMTRASSFFSESFSALGDQAPDRLRAVSHQMRHLLSVHQETDMTVPVLQGLVGLLACLSPDYKNFFLHLVPWIGIGIPNAVKQDETAVCDILRNLAFGSNEVFFTNVTHPHMVAFITHLLGAAGLETHNFDISRRITILIVDLITSNITYATSQFLLSVMLAELFDVLLRMLSNINYNEDRFSRDRDEDEDDAVESRVIFAKSMINRITKKYGGSVTFEFTRHRLRHYEISEDWRQRTASLVVAGRLLYRPLHPSQQQTENELLNNLLEFVMNITINSLRDNHPRVRWTGAKIICRYYSHFRDHQQTFTQLLGILENLAYNEPFSRVRRAIRDARNLLSRKRITSLQDY